MTPQDLMHRVGTPKWPGLGVTEVFPGNREAISQKMSGFYISRVFTNWTKLGQILDKNRTFSGKKLSGSRETFLWHLILAHGYCILEKGNQIDPFLRAFQNMNTVGPACKSH